MAVDNQAPAKIRFMDFLNSEMRRCERRAEWNYRWTRILTFVSVVGSVAASVIVTVPWIPSWVKASASAMPAVALTMLEAFRHPEKHRWYFRKLHGLREIALELDFDDPSIRSAVARLSQLSLEMESSYPGVGLGRRRTTNGTAGKPALRIRRAQGKGPHHQRASPTSATVDLENS